MPPHLAEVPRPAAAARRLRRLDATVAEVEDVDRGILADYGVFLRDGDPAAFQAPDVEVEKGDVPTDSPEDVRAIFVAGLLELVRAAMSDANSLMNIATKAVRNEKFASQLRMYVNSNGKTTRERAFRQDVRRLAGPMLAVLDMERDAAKVVKRRPKIGGPTNAPPKDDRPTGDPRVERAMAIFKTAVEPIGDSNVIDGNFTRTNA